MSTDYTYDEQGQFFPFFILTISGLVTLPLTYSLLTPSQELENTAPRIHSDFRPRDADLIEGQIKKQKRRERRLKRIITAAAGWLMMGYMIYLIMVTARSIPKIWDPYDILGISRSANEKAINKHYKGLARRFHPDKMKPDPAKNQTIESLNDHFVELTKAYKALTDEEVRNNYVQYGHPDGKQSFSIGIALPKLIVTEGNGKYVLLMYGLLLGVLLPYVVGKWWYGTQSITREKVLVTSAGNMFQEYKESMTEGDVLSALSTGEEYNDVLKGGREDHGLGKLERRILAEGTEGRSAGGLESKDREGYEQLSGVRRKALGLLWAYLGRVDLEDSTLNDEKYEVAPIALALNEAFTAISLAFTSTPAIESTFKTSQNLIQAIPPHASPLLQLPYVTPTIAEAIEGGNKTHLTVQQFMQLPDDRRRRAALGPGLLSESEFRAAVGVARQLPVLKVEKAFFKVMGERLITTSSLVQFVIKARIIPPGTTNIPETNELDLEDVDPAEDDLDAILGRKSNKKPKLTDTSKPTPAAKEEKTIQPPLAYAPYFARDHSPRWHVYLADSKQAKVAVPPFTFTTFDKPLFDEQGNPTFAVQTLKMQFQAPPQAGQYTFVMHLICDSYVGIDTKKEVILDVQEMARAEEIVPEDEISEPEEDSLAGQMNALKSGGIAGAPPKSKVKKPTDEDSSDEESDTEGEEEEENSDTDTDTDTDEE
ncbi:MAG: secretory subunit [Candelina submexicana]|nr:MAG: secretory subunit [Candelina submexicana]